MSPRARYFGRPKKLIVTIGEASPEVRSATSIGTNLTQEEEAMVVPWPRRGRRRRMNTVLEDERQTCMAMSLP